MASTKIPQSQEFAVQESYAPSAHHVTSKDVESGAASPSGSGTGNGTQQHGAPEFTALALHPGADATVQGEGTRRGYWGRVNFAYLKTKEFWIVLVLGYVYHRPIFLLQKQQNDINNNAPTT